VTISISSHEVVNPYSKISSTKSIVFWNSIALFSSLVMSFDQLKVGVSLLRPKVEDGVTLF